jgi:membrane associated rhomboid family serine protease
MEARQLYVPPMGKYTKIIIIATVAVTVLNAISTKLGVSLVPYLGLSSATFFQGLVYQVVTYPFINHGLLGLVFECLLLWFLGSELEHTWGPKTYLGFLMASSLGGAIIFVLLGSTLLHSLSYNGFIFGLSGVGYALCLAYAICFSERYLTFMLIFPMKAKWFCLILMGILLYSGFFGSGSEIQTSWGHLAAMGTGYLYLVLKTSNKLPKIKALNFLKFKKKKADLYIVRDDDDDNPPTFH